MIASKVSGTAAAGVLLVNPGRGFFRFAHIDGLIVSDPAVYARVPKIHSDESRAQVWTDSS